MIFMKLFFKNFLNFLRNVRIVDNITKFYCKIVQCCLVLNKIFENIISILQFSNFKKLVKVHGVTSRKNWVKFWKFFFEIWENFFEICTTVYKAGFSKPDDLYNLVTKIIPRVICLMLTVTILLTSLLFLIIIISVRNIKMHQYSREIIQILI